MEISSSFSVRQRRAGWMSATLAFGMHAGLLGLLLCGAISEWSELSGASRMERSASRPEAAPEEGDGPGIELVEVPLSPAPATPDAPSDLEVETVRARLRQDAKARAGESPAEQLADLEKLLVAAAGIGDESLVQMGQVLGARPGEYVPRTYYLDTLNPNANVVKASLVRASRFDDAEGQAGYTLTLQDGEKDQQTVTIRGASARELEGDGLLFAGKPITGAAPPNAASFELLGARIADIQRWQERPGVVRGVVMILIDPAGVKREVHLQSQPHDWGSRMARWYFRKPDGSYLYDPDDETTPFCEDIDQETLSLWRVSEAPERKGERRARIEMIDAKGERLIFFAEGQPAEEFLKRMGGLERNPALRRIYEKTGAAGILRGMLGPGDGDKTRRANAK